MLLQGEIVAMAAHQGKQASIPGAGGIEVPPTRQEVVIDDSDHVEAVGHDARVGEVQPDQRTIVGRQVHGHYPHLGSAF